MSEFAEWRPCRVCGLPVALPKRVHDECAESKDEEEITCLEDIEDEVRDMNQIAREWPAYDRDPPGS